MASPQSKSLRSQVLQQRRRLSTEFIHDASRAITNSVISLAEFQQARHIAAYFPFDNEVDTRFILEAAFNAQKKVFIPVLSEARTLRFAPYTQQAKLKMNCYGIPEPDCADDKLSGLSEMNLLIIPMTCFDKNCNRIGMGAGYYDRTLAQVSSHKPARIGLAYELQHVESTFPQAWDMPMDMVVTEQRIYHPLQN
jgi:5-formyltetrahydrofolate cyclo-ligase